MWLTYEHCLVPKYWMHDYNIKDYRWRSLKDLMIENKMPVPHE